MQWLWSWPTDDPDRSLSVVNGERQDAAAHVARGGRPAVDIPAFPTPGAPCPARVPMHVGARARVKAVINDPNASACGCQLDVWWTWEGVLYEARTCHWERIDVAVGDMLPDWKPAGLMGASGQAQGVHQHYVLTVGGVVVDPEPYLFMDISMDNTIPGVGTGQEQNDGTSGGTLTEEQRTEALALLDLVHGVGKVLTKEQRTRQRRASLGEQVKEAAVRLGELLGLG